MELLVEVEKKNELSMINLTSLQNWVNFIQKPEKDKKNLNEILKLIKEFLMSLSTNKYYEKNDFSSETDKFFINIFTETLIIYILNNKIKHSNNFSVSDNNLMLLKIEILREYLFVFIHNMANPNLINLFTSIIKIFKKSKNIYNNKDNYKVSC